jgi:hypothetical protein
MKTIWIGRDDRVDAHVKQRPDGGVVFRYRPVFHLANDAYCEFTLWCMVGERYRRHFAGFWDFYALADDPVKVPERPYLFDRVKRIA